MRSQDQQAGSDRQHPRGIKMLKLGGREDSDGKAAGQAATKRVGVMKGVQIHRHRTYTEALRTDRCFTWPCRANFACRLVCPRYNRPYCGEDGVTRIESVSEQCAPFGRTCCSKRHTLEKQSSVVMGKWCFVGTGPNHKIEVHAKGNLRIAAGTKR